MVERFFLGTQMDLHQSQSQSHLQPILLLSGPPSWYFFFFFFFFLIKYLKRQQLLNLQWKDVSTVPVCIQRRSSIEQWKRGLHLQSPHLRSQTPFSLPGLPLILFSTISHSSSIFNQDSFVCFVQGVDPSSHNFQRIQMK